MGFTPDQISHIGKLKDEGQTWEDIAAYYGCKPDTVRIAYKRACKSPEPNKTEQKNRIPARTHATNKEPNKTEQTEHEPNKTEQVYEQRIVEVIPAVSKAKTIDELSDLLKMAKQGYERASNQDDESKRTWMEATYMKIMKDCIVQMGKWCGLDGSLMGEDSKPHYTRADIDKMDRETMHRIVQSWKRQ